MKFLKLFKSNNKAKSFSKKSLILLLSILSLPLLPFAIFVLILFIIALSKNNPMLFGLVGASSVQWLIMSLWLIVIVLLVTIKSSVSKRYKTLSNARTGFGYDVHVLQPGAPLVLCATKIEHSKGLVSFSDGDVAIHALIDALLGAAALGDIGTHFPDVIPAYKNISSLTLLNKTIILLKQQNFKPVHVDLTIVAQKPNLSAYFASMKDNLSAALNLTLEDISIKATTEEKLGFTGAEQGIKAFCLATIVKLV